MAQHLWKQVLLNAEPVNQKVKKNPKKKKKNIGKIDCEPFLVSGVDT